MIPKTPIQKYEDILDKLGLRSKINPVDLCYPQFPDKDEKVGECLGRLIVIVNSIDNLNNNKEYIKRINNCHYSVTPLDLDPAAPPMDEQQKAFQECKTEYDNIVDEIYSLVIK